MKTQDIRPIGYVRVSTAEQADSGLGLAAQRATITAEAQRRGWTIVDWFEDAGVSGKSIAGRPGLSAALDSLDSGENGALVVAKLDRLSRSVHDAAGVLDRSGKKGWALVACDLGVDTTTPAGEAMANVMATFAQLERRMIGQRTKDALAVKQAEGVQLGRPRELPEHVADRILGDRLEGRTYTEIAEALDAEGVPTAHGGRRWWPATVRNICQGIARQRQLDLHQGRPTASDGRPRAGPEAAPKVVARILREREEGLSYAAIANGLQDDAVPTARGGARWHASTVRSMCVSHAEAFV